MGGKESIQARHQALSDLHLCMDEEDALVWAEPLREAAACKDTNELWGLITACAERAFVKFLGLSGPAAAWMRRRSRVEIKSQLVGSPTRTVQPMPEEAAELKRRAGKHVAQANRLVNIARRMQVCRAAGHAVHKKETNERLNNETFKVYVKQAMDSSKDEEHQDALMKNGKQVSEACMEASTTVRIREPTHAAKVLKLADAHREVVAKMMNAVKIENQHRQNVRDIGRKIDHRADPP